MFYNIFCYSFTLYFSLIAKQMQIMEPLKDSKIEMLSCLHPLKLVWCPQIKRNATIASGMNKIKNIQLLFYEGRAAAVKETLFKDIKSSWFSVLDILFRWCIFSQWIWKNQTTSVIFLRIKIATLRFDFTGRETLVTDEADGKTSKERSFYCNQNFLLQCYALTSEIWAKQTEDRRHPQTEMWFSQKWVFPR